MYGVRVCAVSDAECSRGCGALPCVKEAPAVKAAQVADDLSSLSAHCRILESRIERYQALCAAAYQLAGAVDAPLRFLDALSEGANGNPLPEEMSLALVPVTAAECMANLPPPSPADERAAFEQLKDWPKMAPREVFYAGWRAARAAASPAVLTDHTFGMFLRAIPKRLSDDRDDRAMLRKACELLLAEAQPAQADLQAEVDRLNAIINTPHTDNFLQAVSIEAEHQRQRWNDSNKTAPDWFWLVGYLAGKALAATLAGDHTKAAHHMITTAAALANWHRTGTCPHGHTGDWSDNCPDCRH
ncbi:hypothetical protein [Burkholderia cenocepacia]|uniref:hypothetical protein n=1 Tax=Burkholderia cenocepacia TaxID=95486 RepID=UPI002650E7E3|nr:hypothetical protein [Burkholderia cenocepacia]MDN7537015.1 hypothetical protein [Burkholderia cenocepacia]